MTVRSFATSQSPSYTDPDQNFFFVLLLSDEINLSYFVGLENPERKVGFQHQLNSWHPITTKAALLMGSYCPLLKTSWEDGLIVYPNESRVGDYSLKNTICFTSCARQL